MQKYFKLRYRQQKHSCPENDLLLIDIVMSGRQSVYSVDIMQIVTRNASLVRPSIALSTSRRAQVEGEEKKGTARSLGLSLSACLGQVLNLFRTARPKNHTLSSGTYPYNPSVHLPHTFIHLHFASPIPSCTFIYLHLPASTLIYVHLP